MGHRSECVSNYTYIRPGGMLEACSEVKHVSCWFCIRRWLWWNGPLFRGLDDRRGISHVTSQRRLRRALPFILGLVSGMRWSKWLMVSQNDSLVDAFCVLKFSYSWLSSSPLASLQTWHASPQLSEGKWGASLSWRTINVWRIYRYKTTYLFAIKTVRDRCIGEEKLYWNSNYLGSIRQT